MSGVEIKRKAHAASRGESSISADKWNPFRHVWAQKRQRSHTWDLEAERYLAEVDQDDAVALPLEPSLTALPQGQASNGGPTQVNNDIPESPTCGSESEIAVPSQATDVSEIGLRKRKTGISDITPAISGRDDEKYRKLNRLVKAVYPQKEPFTVANQIERTLLAAWINVLLLCVPAGLAVNYVLGPSLSNFIVNFIAIVPLFFMTDLATDDLSKRLGQNLCNFLSFSISNLFQLISCLLLLVHRQVTVLKLSLIGGILCNILLLLGFSILLGGLVMRRQQQYFNLAAAHTSAIMLSLASTSLLIPTACRLLAQTSPENIIKQSRGAAIVLMTVYAIYLWCILGTHFQLFSEEAEKSPSKRSKHELDGNAVKAALIPVGIVATPGSYHDGGSNNKRLRHLIHEAQQEVHDDTLAEENVPQLNLVVAVLVVLASGALLFLCTENVVNSIDALVEDHGLTPTFVGLILLPLPNCDFSPITVAIRDDLTSALDYTVVRSIQTALLILPFTVLLGWWIGIEEATLVFDGFEVISLFATIILLNLIMVDGRSFWVMGVLLLGDWCLIAIAAFYVDA